MQCLWVLRRTTLQSFLKMLKVNHYIKNLVVAVPLLFSKNFVHIDLLLNTIYIIVAFCFISSCVYIINDLIDIKKDRLHPVKCKRPIASGKISIPVAVSTCVLLFILSSVISCLVSPFCLLFILLYLVLNILYSFVLKNIIIIDIACIALGFIFRILGGCFAISVLPSPLVILLTFFLSMFFTCTKRKLELQVMNNDSSARASLKDIDLNTINQFILINAILAISFYFTYVLDEETIRKAGTPYLYITVIPFTLILFRLFLLINTSKIADDPIIYLEKDTTIKWLFVFYFVTFGILLLIK